MVFINPNMVLINTNPKNKYAFNELNTSHRYILCLTDETKSCSCRNFKNVFVDFKLSSQQNR